MTKQEADMPFPEGMLAEAKRRQEEAALPDRIAAVTRRLDVLCALTKNMTQSIQSNCQSQLINLQELRQQQ